jgi:hypothetical protein
MFRLLRKPCVLFLLCFPFLLAGCHQHPLAASIPGRQSAGANTAAINAGATVCVEQATIFTLPAVETKDGALKTETGAPKSPRPKEGSLIAGTHKEPDCLTGQLGDGLILVFKSFTGR